MSDIKLAGKKQNLDPMWKILNKEVGLGGPTSFIDHVYLECTQRQLEMSKEIVDNYRTMFKSRISAGATERLPSVEIQKIFTWSHDMESHAKKLWNAFVNWQTKQRNSCTKYPLLVLTTISSKKNN